MPADPVMSTPRTILPRPRRRGRRAAIALGTLVVVAALVVLALPALLRAGIPWYLSGRGVQASVEDVSVDLWDGRVRLTGLRVGPEEQVTLRFQQLQAVLDWSELLSGGAPLERVELAGGELDVGALGETRLEGREGAAGETRRGAPPIPQVDLRDIALTDLGRRIGQPLAIRSVRVVPDGPPGADSARVSLEAALGGAPVTLNGSLSGLSGAPRFRGRLRAVAVRLQGLEHLAPAGVLSRLDGVATVDTALEADFDARRGRVRLLLQGTHGVQDAAVRSAVAGGTGSATLDGRVQVDWPLLATPEVRVDGVLRIPDMDVELARGDDGGSGTRLRLTEARFDGRASIDESRAPAAAGRVAWRSAALATGGDTPLAVEVERIEAYLDSGAPSDRPAAPRPLRVDEVTADRVWVAPVGEGFTPVELLGLRGQVLRVDGGEALAIRARVLAASRLRSPRDGAAWQVDTARLEGAHYAADGAITVAHATAGAVAVGSGDARTELVDLTLSGFRRATDGALAAAKAAVASLQVPVSGAPLEAEAVAVSALSLAADGAVGVARAEVAAARHAPAGASAWSVDKAVGEAVAVSAGRRVSLESVSLAAARVQAGDARVELSDAAATGLEVSAERQVSLKSASLGAARGETGDARVELADAAVNGLVVSPDGTLEASDARVQQVRADLGTRGALDVEAADVAGLRVDGPAQLVLERAATARIEFRRGQETVRVSAPEVERFAAAPGTDGPELTVSRVSVQEVAASAAGDVAPVTLAGASLSAARLGGAGSLALDAMRLSRLRVGQEDAPVLALGILDLRDLTYESGGVVLAGGAVADLQASVVRGADGTLALPQLPFAGPPGAGGGVGEAGAPAVRIGRLETSGDTRLEFVDREPDPPFRVLLDPLSLTVEDLDTRPDGEAGRFTVSGRVGEFSRLEFNGRTQPRKAGLDLGFDGRLTGVDLGLLTPYLSRLQGVAVKTGRADVRFSGSLAAGDIEAETEFLLSKLTLEPGAKAGAGDGKSGGMPLSTALMLLKDDQDNVRLKVPVSGKLTDPRFDLSDAVGQAVAKAATGAVMLAFQPVGLLVTAAGVVGGLSGVGFEPVRFQPADAELGADSITRLDALAQALASKPALKLRVCGRATPDDAKALAAAGKPADGDAMAALARERGAKVRGYLESRYPMEVGRLPECPPVVDAEEAGGPRADLVLDTGPAAGGVAPAEPSRRN